MNTNLPNNSNLPPNQNKSTDEVDLIVLFNYIGKGFSNLFKAIGRFFKYLFKLLIYALKPIVKYWKIIGITVFCFAVLGKFLDARKPAIFSSNMLVKPYFDSKYQLINNVEYYNALIVNQNFDILADVFNIDQETAETIVEIELNIAPETENDRLLEYETFIAEMDTVKAKEFTYAQYLENRTIYSVNFYEIKVRSLKNDVFTSLESGLNSSFTNRYSELKMKKRDAVIELQRNSILASLSKVDSLKKVYIQVLEEESKSPARKGITLGEGLTFEKDKSVTKEYELLNKEIQLREKLRELDERRVEEDVLFDVVSRFQKIGNRDDSVYNSYTLLFPAIAFLMLCLIYLTIKTIKFIKRYEE